MTDEARAELYADMDAANVDLKAFTEDFYHKIDRFRTSTPVLETLEVDPPREQTSGSR